jgi:hypothetical protein
VQGIFYKHTSAFYNIKKQSVVPNLLDIWQRPMNQDNTDTNEYLFSQFLPACFYSLDKWKEEKKIGQAFGGLIHICTVPVQWYLY